MPEDNVLNTQIIPKNSYAIYYTCNEQNESGGYLGGIYLGSAEFDFSSAITQDTELTAQYYHFVDVSLYINENNVDMENFDGYNLAESQFVEDLGSVYILPDLHNPETSYYCVNGGKWRLVFSNGETFDIYEGNAIVWSDWLSRGNVFNFYLIKF